MELVIYNLKRDCEEKDVTIKELSEFIRTKDVADSKKVEELEDIIQQKTMIISKLRKDMAVLEQKVVQLTRLGQRSFSGQTPQPIEIPETRDKLAVRDNLLYDMDSTTSPSSSDSDCSSTRNKNNSSIQNILTAKPTPNITQNSAPAKVSTVATSAQDSSISKAVSSLQVKPKNQSYSAACSAKKKPLSANGDLKKGRRSLTGFRDAAAPSQKRWV